VYLAPSEYVARARPAPRTRTRGAGRDGGWAALLGPGLDLLESGQLFARKFDETVDFDVLDALDRASAFA